MSKRRKHPKRRKSRNERGKSPGSKRGRRSRAHLAPGDSGVKVSDESIALVAEGVESPTWGSEVQASPQPRVVPRKQHAQTTVRKGRREWVSPLEMIYLVAFLFGTYKLFFATWTGLHGSASGGTQDVELILLAGALLAFIFFQFSRSYYHLHRLDDAGRNSRHHFIDKFTGVPRLVDRMMRLSIAAMLVVLFKSGHIPRLRNGGYEIGKFIGDANLQFDAWLTQTMGKATTGGEGPVQAIPAFGPDVELYGYIVGLISLLLMWLIWDSALVWSWAACRATGKEIPDTIERAAQEFLGVTPERIRAAAREASKATDGGSNKSLSVLLPFKTTRFYERAFGIAFCVLALGYLYTGGKPLVALLTIGALVVHLAAIWVRYHSCGRSLLEPVLDIPRIVWTTLRDYFAPPGVDRPVELDLGGSSQPR